MSDERDGAAPGSNEPGDDDATPPTDRSDTPAERADPEPGGAASPTGKRRSSGPARRDRPVTPAAGGSKAARGAATPRRAVAEAPPKGSPLARLTRFLREVAAELRKVIWPTRKQLVTYTVVVLVFVTFMVALVAGLDIVFARGVLSVFG